MTTSNSLLVGGARGWHTGNGSVTYAFMGATIPAYYPRVDTDGDGEDDTIQLIEGETSLDLPVGTDATMSAAERALAERAVSAWNEVANINLVRGSGDIMFGAAEFGDPGLFGFVAEFPGEPGTLSPHGDLWINRSNELQTAATFGNTGWQTYLHELGHALGLHHPDEDPDNEQGDPRNNNQYTVMSYAVHPGQAGVADTDSAWPITPMLFDIQAVQALYGPNLDTRTGDTTYFAAPPAGGEGAFALADGGLLATGIGAILCVWDADGTDTLSAANQSGAVTLDLNPGAFSTIGAIANNISLMTAVTVGGVVVNLIENAVGGAGNDTITGNSAANLLDGGGGADTMRGRGGNDIFMVNNANDKAIEAAGDGDDLVKSTVSFTLGSNVERLMLFGSAANGTGNGLANAIIGNGVANILNGGAGADMLRGLGGNDTYVVDNIGDVLVEVASGGVDIVQASLDWTLGANLETLMLTGAALRGTGNGAANSLFGNGLGNVLDGAGGADAMRGGAGNDIYVVDHADDKAIEAAGAGTDLVRASVSFTIGSNVENLTLLGTAANGTGNSLANAIAGNSAANLLDGGGGADTMRGSTGNDTYVVDNAGDTALENLDAGSDLVRAAVSFAIGANVENLTLTGTAAINGTGNSLANILLGNGAANTLNGAGGADSLNGGLGDDRLFGGAGHDDLRGGTGADKYFFDSALSTATNVDDILDFSTADDVIVLDRTIFAGITASGTLNAAAFRAGTAAADASDRIVYDSATGQIFYDSDGNGSAAAILFATVTPGIVLTSADFIAVA